MPESRDKKINSKPLLKSEYMFLFFLIMQDENENESLALTSMEAEFTRPLWVFGYHSYDFISSEKNADFIACSYRSLMLEPSSLHKLVLFDLHDFIVCQLQTKWTIRISHFGCQYITYLFT